VKGKLKVRSSGGPLLLGWLAGFVSFPSAEAGTQGLGTLSKHPYHTAASPDKLHFFPLIFY
jgi:hypothetical protein